MTSLFRQRGDTNGNTRLIRAMNSLVRCCMGKCLNNCGLFSQMMWSYECFPRRDVEVLMQVIAKKHFILQEIATK